MIYDTLKPTKALEIAFPQEQAEAVATALTASTQETLVTKSDLDAAIARLQAETIKWVARPSSSMYSAPQGLLSP